MYKKKLQLMVGAALSVGMLTQAAELPLIPTDEVNFQENANAAGQEKDSSAEVFSADPLENNSSLSPNAQSLPEQTSSSSNIPRESNAAETVDSTEPIPPTSPSEQFPSLSSEAAPPIALSAEKVSQPQPEGGITTLDLEEGNWFLKRQALEKTMNVIESLNNIFTKVLDLRMTFLVKRNKVDRDFDLFAQKTGFELGDLSQMITGFIEQMEKERLKEGQLSEDERQFLKQMEDKLAELKKLQTDISAITDMDAAIDEVLMQLEKEIDQTHQNQMQGWRNFQSIKKVLNDEKAEELYLRTEGLLTNTKDIYTYLNGQLLAYFSKTIQTLQDTMAQATQKLEGLKSSGSDLKQTLATFMKNDTQSSVLQENEREQEKITKIKQEAAALAKSQCVPFSTQLINYLKSPFVWVWSTIQRILGR